MRLSDDVSYFLSFLNLIIYDEMFLFSKLLFKNLSDKYTAFNI